jgi:hypothetical protein
MSGDWWSDQLQDTNIPLLKVFFIYEQTSRGYFFNDNKIKVEISYMH